MKVQTQAFFTHSPIEIQPFAGNQDACSRHHSSFEALGNRTNKLEEQENQRSDDNADKFLGLELWSGSNTLTHIIPF